MKTLLIVMIISQYGSLQKTHKYAFHTESDCQRSIITAKHMAPRVFAFCVPNTYPNEHEND